jgi:hypothetical protein
MLPINAKIPAQINKKAMILNVLLKRLCRKIIVINGNRIHNCAMLRIEDKTDFENILLVNF